MGELERWFPFGYQTGKSHHMDLFCFHCAGGSSSIYRSWIGVNADVQVVPVELPGRGTRTAEPLPMQFDKLCQMVTEVLLSVNHDRRFVLFGHSMGAAIAFEVACLMEQKYGVQPDKVVVAGRHAPHHPDPSPFRSTMDDEALVRELRRLEGTPQEVLENEELLRYLLPIIRRDYRLHEYYEYQGRQVEAPLIAHAGKMDQDAPESTMRYWKEMARGAFHIREFAGNHFFIRNREYAEALMKEVVV